MSNNWQQWCRFCLKNDEADNRFIESEKMKSTIKMHFSSFSIVSKKENHFSLIKITYNSKIFQFSKSPILICAECHEFIENLIKFSERCRKVDIFFNKFLSLNESDQKDEKCLQSLLQQVGLDEEVLNRHKTQ